MKRLTFRGRTVLVYGGVFLAGSVVAVVLFALGLIGRGGVAATSTSSVPAASTSSAPDAATVGPGSDTATAMWLDIVDAVSREPVVGRVVVERGAVAEVVCVGVVHCEFSVPDGEGFEVRVSAEGYLDFVMSVSDPEPGRGMLGGAAMMVKESAGEPVDGLVLENGEGVRWGLDETAAEDEEAVPTMTVRLFLEDGDTGEPVAGDVFLYRKLRHESLTVVEPLLTIPCEAAQVCVLEDVPNPEAGYLWVVQVRAAGYRDWVIELDFNTDRSRDMQLPVRLERLETGTQG